MMLNRVLIAAATAVAAAAIAAPTMVGLTGNSSFSRSIPVPVPAGAHHVRLSDPADDRSPSGQPTSSGHPSSAARTSHAEDDRPGGVTSTARSDDHGGLRDTTVATPRPAATSTEDRGGSDDHGSGRSRGGHG
jgi:hypothetical protein